MKLRKRKNMRNKINDWGRWGNAEKIEEKQKCQVRRSHIPEIVCDLIVDKD